MDQKHCSLTGLTVVLTAVLLLAGCFASSQKDESPDVGSAIAPAQVPAPPATDQAPPIIPVPRPPAPPRENHLSPATSALVMQSRNLLAHGDIDGASSTLDRALRIEPNNPLVWIEIGKLRLVESDSHQAEGCGRKALALASGDRGTQRQAGRLLADALRAQQRNQEAHDVESQAYMQVR